MVESSDQVTEQEKDEARAIVLAKLFYHRGPVVGTMREIRDKLDLTYMSMRLFKSSCGHLSVGDRDPNRIARVGMKRKNDPETQWRDGDHIYVIWALHH